MPRLPLLAVAAAVAFAGCAAPAGLLPSRVVCVEHPGEISKQEGEAALGDVVETTFALPFATCEVLLQFDLNGKALVFRDEDPQAASATFNLTGPDGVALVEFHAVPGQDALSQSFPGGCGGPRSRAAES